jgi:hypothetical protein
LQLPFLVLHPARHLGAGESRARENHSFDRRRFRVIPKVKDAARARTPAARALVSGTASSISPASSIRSGNPERTLCLSRYRAGPSRRLRPGGEETGLEDVSRIRSNDRARAAGRPCTSTIPRPNAVRGSIAMRTSAKARSVLPRSVSSWTSLASRKFQTVLETPERQRACVKTWKT